MSKPRQVSKNCPSCQSSCVRLETNSPAIIYCIHCEYTSPSLQVHESVWSSIKTWEDRAYNRGVEVGIVEGKRRAAQEQENTTKGNGNETD